MRGLVVALIVFLLAFAQPVSAGIFSDIPSDHPVRECIEVLANKGIITGFAGDTFAGNRKVTRYELAMSLFRTIAALEEQITADSPAMTDEDCHNIEYLKKEFAEELFLMGMRAEIIQNRVTQIREDIDRLRVDIKSVENNISDSTGRVTIDGDWLVRNTWKTHRDDHPVNAFSGISRPGNSNNNLAESQIRLRFIARVADNITIFSRLRLFNRGSDAVSAPQSMNGGAFGLNGIGAASNGDMQVDCAYVEIKKAFHPDSRLVLGRSSMQTGHGLLLNADFDAIRYIREFADASLQAQYIYDRHRGSFADAAVVNFRGVINAGYSRKLKFSSFYANIFAQDEPNLINRRIANTFKLGTDTGKQASDRRRDFETGYTGKFGKKKALTADIAVALTNYRAEIAAAPASKILDVDLKGMAGHAALTWQARKSVSAKLAWNFGDDKFAGAYSLDTDRRLYDFAETPYEDISHGNSWFSNGLQNMSDLKFQVEYKPAGRHYFRIAADFLRELKDQVRNDLSHHLAGNSDGVIPVGFVTANSAYDTFNNVGIADPSMRIISFEYRHQLKKHTRLRVGAVACNFSGTAFRQVGASKPVSAGLGFRGDYDYQMVWAEIFSSF